MADNKTPITGYIRERLEREIDLGLRSLEEIERDLQAGKGLWVPTYEALDIVATCAILGRSESTVRRLIKRGRLQAFTFDGIVCVDLDSVAVYLFEWKYRAVHP